MFLANSSLGFLNVIVRLTDLINEGGRLSKIDDFYRKIRTQPWLKRETHVFQYGYYYALSVVLISVAAICGPYVPILYPCCCFYLLAKSLADGVTFICIYGKDVDGNGKLFEAILRRLLFGALIGHAVLINRCYWDDKTLALAVNSVVFIVGLVIQALLKRSTVSDFRTLVRLSRHEEYKIPTLNDKADWVYHYAHPFVKKSAYAAEYIERFNAALGVPPLDLKPSNEQEKHRFELLLQQPLETSRRSTCPIVKTRSSIPALEGYHGSKLETVDYALSIPPPLDPLEKLQRDTRNRSRDENPRLHTIIERGLRFESMKETRSKRVPLNLSNINVFDLPHDNEEDIHDADDRSLQ